MSQLTRYLHGSHFYKNCIIGNPEFQQYDTLAMFQKTNIEQQNQDKYMNIYVFEGTFCKSSICTI